MSRWVSPPEILKNGMSQFQADIQEADGKTVAHHQIFEGGDEGSSAEDIARPDRATVVRVPGKFSGHRKQQVDLLCLHG